MTRPCLPWRGHWKRAATAGTCNNCWSRGFSADEEAGMNDWTAGYVADIGYTFGYYDELNPLRARLALLNKGFALPAMGQACELGFGQGVSINFHAAGGSAQWYGCDFNPSQAAFAIDLAKAGGREPLLTDDSFAEFCARHDLPAFDFIGLH